MVREFFAQLGAALWPMGGVLSGSLLIAWATEVLSFFLSRGLAFALLAFLQVLPEFAVEAVITYEAGVQQTPEALELISANFTGANRLIVGLFIPMVFIVAWYKARRGGYQLKEVVLPRASSVEVLALLAATVYSFLIPLKGTLDLLDAVILTSTYGVYLWMVYRLPPSDEEHATLPLVPRKIRAQPVVNQRWIITFLFIVGGLLLLASVHPFYENTIHLAMLFGIPAYFLFQWIAPMLSEFPEFVTILYWGKTGREQLGLTNAISSKVNQWTLLLAMIPVVFAYATYSMGNFSWSTPFDDKQRVEILLTSAQSLFAAACLIDLRFQAWQAWTILGMWAAQLVDPLVDPYIELWLPFLTNTPFGTEAYIREWFVWVYLALVVVVVWHERGRFDAFPGFAAEWREHIRPGAPRVGEPAPGEEPHVGGP